MVRLNRLTPQNVASTRRRLSIRTFSFLLTVLVAAALMAGCGKRSESYFPLQSGRKFTYRIRLESEGTAGIETYKSFAVNLPARSIDGVKTTPRLFQDGRVLYYAEDDAGLRTVAFQKPGEDPSAAETGQYVIKYPLQAGTHWRAPGRTVLLTQRFLYSKALPIGIAVDLDYAIEKTGETVRVPAGRFADCIEIKATGATTVTTADNQTSLEVHVDIVEWYAPGVGLVKSERTEKAGEERAGNARSASELEYVSKPSWFD